MDFFDGMRIEKVSLFQDALEMSSLALSTPLEDHLNDLESTLVLGTTSLLLVSYSIDLSWYQLRDALSASTVA